MQNTYKTPIRCKNRINHLSLRIILVFLLFAKMFKKFKILCAKKRKIWECKNSSFQWQIELILKSQIIELIKSFNLVYLDFLQPFQFLRQKVRTNIKKNSRFFSFLARNALGFLVSREKSKCEKFATHIPNPNEKNIMCFYASD